jgi:NAD(P)-dependent dehydrogenase (short-subunit alcohol dehydrogenase family)
MGERFAGKVAVVVGGANGIGAATARLLAAEGATVAVADIDAVGAEKLAAELGEAGRHGTAVGMDLRDEASVAAMVQAVVASFGRIDMLYNVAADTAPSTIGTDSDAVSLPLDTFDRTLQVNLRGYLLTIRHTIPAMLDSGGGAIVCTSSLAAYGGGSTLLSYGVSKAGVHALTRYVASTWGKQGIRCNTVVLGMVMTEALRTGITPEAMRQLSAQLHVPEPGTPEDVANVVAFLLSDEARYINGDSIRVDGGMGIGQGGS